MIKNKNVLIKNIYYMLAYAFRALKLSAFEDIDVEEFEDMHNLFAAILEKGITQQLKRGLHREYLNRQGDLTILRGKINIPGTIKNKLNRKNILTCEYDELSENNLLNQILKTTLMLLLRHAKVQPEYKDKLKRIMMFFSNVDTLEPSSIKWSSIRFQRNNQTYRVLISFCQLAIEGMLITTDKGEHKLASFLDDQHMSRLYEKFIFEYYKQEFQELNVSASQIKWAIDDGVGTLLPVMQSDVTIQKGGTVLIIDAKYYGKTTQMQYNSRTIHSGNLYQIFTYVKNKDLEFGEIPHVVSGMLLYAKTEEETQPDNSYLMSGNKISVMTLDFNCSFKEITKQLNAIVQEHFGITSSL